MNFWIFAIALLAVPAAVISWPFFTGSAKERVYGMFMLLLMPLTGLLLYQYFGTPAAINLPTATAQPSAQEQQAHSSQQAQMDELVTSLQQRMNENPDDPEGWLILGRSLKTMQRYAEAQTALSNANRLIPGNALVMVELAETILFASGKPQVNPEARQLIKSALAIDPQQQKALWLMGMVASQDGDEAQAITLWQRLLGQLDPASGATNSVTQQIEMAQKRLGQPVSEPVGAKPAVAKPVVAGFSIPVNITIADDLAGALPENAILFIFIRPVGTLGMPLAVKRMSARGFPMSLQFSDADLLRPGASLQDFEQLDISARISMAGVANAAPGDYQANLVTLDTKAVTAIALHLDQRVP